MSIEELQQSIGEWHEKTYGDCPQPRIALKVLEESAELYAAVKLPNNSLWETLEAADVLIALLALSHRGNMNLMRMAEEKFELVKKRDQKQRDIERGY